VISSTEDQTSPSSTIESDPLYQQLLERLTERLAPYPRYALLNALLYTTVVGVIASLVLVTFFFFFYVAALVILYVLPGWAVLVAIYSGVRFFDSGAWRPQRERWIRKELGRRKNVEEFEVDEAFAARLDQMHAPLSEAIATRTRLYRRLALHALLNVAAWIMIYAIVYSPSASEPEEGLTIPALCFILLIMIVTPILSVLVIPHKSQQAEFTHNSNVPYKPMNNLR
jgi:small-conductance mechanosensitive channel